MLDWSTKIFLTDSPQVDRSARNAPVDGNIVEISAAKFVSCNAFKESQVPFASIPRPIDDGLLNDRFPIKAKRSFDFGRYIGNQLETLGRIC